MSYKGGIKDSGQRTEFETGSHRDLRVGKGRFDLLQFMAIRDLAIHNEFGAIKYNANNWRKGIPYSSYISSTFGHFIKWILGWDDENHLIAAIWNLCCLYETMIMIERGKLSADLDDRYADLLDDLDFENTVAGNGNDVFIKE
jgi:hypothetical protein